MRPNVANSVNRALLGCDYCPTRLLLLFRLSIHWLITRCFFSKHDFRLAAEKVFFLERHSLVRMHNLARLRCHLLPLWHHVTLLHAVLELNEVLEEYLKFEVLINEQCSLIVFYQEKYGF